MHQLATTGGPGPSAAESCHRIAESRATHAAEALSLLRRQGRRARSVWSFSVVPVLPPPPVDPRTVARGVPVSDALQGARGKACRCRSTAGAAGVAASSAVHRLPRRFRRLRCPTVPKRPPPESGRSGGAGVSGRSRLQSPPVTHPFTSSSPVPASPRIWPLTGAPSTRAGQIPVVVRVQGR